MQISQQTCKVSLSGEQCTDLYENNTSEVVNLITFLSLQLNFTVINKICGPQKNVFYTEMLHHELQNDV